MTIVPESQLIMGIIERREREKQELRQKILDTAREMFVAEGYEAVTMRKIAQKIEYSPTSIYLHFKDKEALFAELCNSDFLQLAHVLTSIAQIDDAIERLRRIGQGYLDFAMRFPNHYRLMFMTPHPCVEPDEQALVKGNPEEDAYAFLKETVEQALAKGCFRPEIDDAELVAQTLWAGVHGVASLQIAKHSDYWVDWRSIEARSELMLDSILRGMLKVGSPVKGRK